MGASAQSAWQIGNPGMSWEGNLSCFQNCIYCIVTDYFRKEATCTRSGTTLISLKDMLKNGNEKVAFD